MKKKYKDYIFIKTSNKNINDKDIFNFEKLYKISLEIIKIEKEDSTFYYDLISYIDSNETLFEIADQLKFTNLEKIINSFNLDLIIGIVEVGFNCHIEKKLEGNCNEKNMFDIMC